MTTPSNPYDPTPRVTDEHRRLASELLGHGPITLGGGGIQPPRPSRTEVAAALAAAEQRGAAKLAATITLHAKDAGEASTIYAARVSALAGRRDQRSRAEAAEAAVRAGQASAVQQALRGVLSA